MRALLGLVLLASTLVLAPGPASAAPARAAAGDAAGDVVLDGVTVHLRRGTRQALTVRHTRGYHARATLWAWRDGRWVRRQRTTDARIGYGGLVAAHRRHQGTGTTPLGTFRLSSAFGTRAKAAGWHLGYRRIRRGDFWVEDNASRYYNRYRNQRQGGFRWRLPASDENSSERLSDYPVQYELSIVTSFNHRQVRHRGAGIFVHVNGSGATAGCVSAPRRFLRGLMARLAPRQVPVVAIGR